MKKDLQLAKKLLGSKDLEIAEKRELCDKAKEERDMAKNDFQQAMKMLVSKDFELSEKSELCEVAICEKEKAEASLQQEVAQFKSKDLETTKNVEFCEKVIMRIAESSQNVKAERDEAQNKLKLAVDQLEASKMTRIVETETKLKMALEDLKSRDREIVKMTNLSQQIILQRDEAQTNFTNARDQLGFVMAGMADLMSAKDKEILWKNSIIARQKEKIEELMLSCKL